MKRRASIRPEAQADIREAVSWYESREPGLGIRFKLEARTAIRRIGDNAMMFPAIDERVRRALRCLHQHRHPDTWKARP